jgi:hypothetical protein
MEGGFRGLYCIAGCFGLQSIWTDTAWSFGAIGLSWLPSISRMSQTYEGFSLVTTYVLNAFVDLVLPLLVLRFAMRYRADGYVRSYFRQMRLS